MGDCRESYDSISMVAPDGTRISYYISWSAGKVPYFDCAQYRYADERIATQSRLLSGLNIVEKAGIKINNTQYQLITGNS